MKSIASKPKKKQQEVELTIGSISQVKVLEANFLQSVDDSSICTPLTPKRVGQQIKFPSVSSRSRALTCSSEHAGSSQTKARPPPPAPVSLAA